MNAALYVRASTEQQRYSTSNQIEALRTFAQARGFNVSRVYEDNGRSGLDLEGRPGLRQLLADVLIDSRPFDILLVYDISRWGRFQDADEGAHYEFLCRQAGVPVVYAAEPFIDDLGPMSSVIKAVKRAMAAEYSRDLSRKVILGQRRLIAEGFSQGGIPGLGFRRQLVDHDRQPKSLLNRGEIKSIQSDRVTLVTGPEVEVDLVRRIFSMCGNEGLGPCHISNVLEAEGIPTTKGGRRWREGSVRAILRNDKYIGRNSYGRVQHRLRSKARQATSDEITVKEGAFPALVSRALFDRVQKRIAVRQFEKTDAEMIDDLKAVLAKHGRLSSILIDKTPGVSAAATFASRFGGLLNAFRAAGYEPPDLRPFQRRNPRDRQWLLDKLREVLAREGQLSFTILAADPTVPSYRAYQWEFGQMAVAYGLIGYKQTRIGRPTPRRYSAMPNSKAPPTEG